MENQVRIFREQPFGWFDKPIMRYLREKYGGNKKIFIALRATYLAICEMESDFESNAISAFNKTVGTYAGLSREAVGKYVKMLEKEGLIQKVRTSDPPRIYNPKAPIFEYSARSNLPRRIQTLTKKEQSRNVPYLRHAPECRGIPTSGYPDIRIPRQ